MTLNPELTDLRKHLHKLNRKLLPSEVNQGVDLDELFGHIGNVDAYVEELRDRLHRLEENR